MITEQHIVRFGTNAEKKYLAEFKDSYGLLLVNANIFAHCTDSVSRFISEDLARKNFIIDPQTYAFQYYPGLINQNTNEVKKSIIKLLDFYGEKLKDIVISERRSLQLSDFDDKDSFIIELCHNVIDFQKDTVKTCSLDSSEYSEYIQYDIDTEGNIQIEPMSLIAPYFYLSEEGYNKWLDINCKAIKVSKEYNKDKISAQLVLNSNLLMDDSKIDNLVQKYAEAKPDEILLWIDSFDEKDTGELPLQKYIRLLKKFKEVNIPVSQLYGSYFSMVLVKLGLLTGCCHGMEYGESRSVFPVGGGVPISKFYLPIAHRRFHFRNIVPLLLDSGWLDTKESFFSNVCNCKQCREIIKNDPKIDIKEYGDFNTVTNIRRKKNGQEYSVMMAYPTSEAKEVCLKHYLYNKKNECDYLNREDINTVLQQLSDAYNKISSKMGIETLYLLAWYNVLSKCINDNK